MHKTSRYTVRKVIQMFSVAVLVLLLILVMSKISHIVNKVFLIKQAEILYEKKEWIETEAALQKAQKYSGFNYKEELLESYLKELRFITQFNSFLKQLLQEITVSYTTNQYEDFIKSYKAYQASGFDGLDQVKRRYLLGRYPVKEELHKGWQVFKLLMEEALSHPVNNSQYQWAKQAIWDLPEDYFDGDKGAIIKKLFIACDTTLFTETKNIKGDVLSFQKLLQNMNAIYTTNEKYGYKSEWLTIKLKPYIEKLIKEKSNTDNIGEFAGYAKAYAADVMPYYESQAVKDTTEKFIRDQEDKAEFLTNHQEYKKAIQIYQDMAIFKDYSNEMKQVAQIEKYEHAPLLLSKPSEMYDLIKEGTGEFGGEKYIIAVQKDTRILELVVIKGTRSEYATSTYQTITEKTKIEDIVLQEQLILLLSSGDTRTHSYQVLEFSGEGFITLLNIEADHIEVIENDNSLKINSPLGGYQGYDYEYVYTKTGYEDLGIIAEAVNLNDINLNAYTGKVIKFDCYVPAEYAGHEALGVYIENDIYYPDTAVKLYQESGDPIEAKYYSIIGEYVDNEIYYNDTLNRDATRPRIKIISME